MFKKTSYRISETHPFKWERNSKKGAKIRIKVEILEYTTRFGSKNIFPTSKALFSIFIPLHTQVDKV